MNNNLIAMHRAMGDLSYTETSSFRNIFIGSLSTRVSEDEWRKALEISVNIVKEGRWHTTTNTTEKSSSPSQKS